jgi:hypothetical protein
MDQAFLLGAVTKKRTIKVGLRHLAAPEICLVKVNYRKIAKLTALRIEELNCFGEAR